MVKIGKIETVEIRKVWKMETDFSDWLAHEDQLEYLGEAIGIQLIDAKREEAVGDFSADIVAIEDGTDRKVIIENQYDRTNHDHLGKLITYASGTGAKTIVWIVEDAREEHRSAIRWLNEVSDEDVGFFLVKISVIKIGTSDPAPQFEVLERPNDWTRSVRNGNNGRHGASSSTQEKQLAFFNEFLDYAMERTDFAALFRRVKAKPQHWLNLPMGSGNYHMSLTAITDKKHGVRVGVEVYIGNDKEQYHIFESHKEEIESELGENLDWMELPTKKASRILLISKINWLDELKRKDCCKWLTDAAIKFRNVFPKYDA